MSKIVGEDGKAFYTATTDSAFKAIFCNPKNEDLLIALLKETLKREDIKITKLIPPENLKHHISEKNKTLDVVIETKGEVINIEVTIGTYSGLHRRNAAYIFNRYSTNVKTKSSYKNMDNIIQINLTEKLDIKDRILKTYKLKEEETKEEFIDNLTIYEYNLSKIKDMCYNGKEEKYKLLAALCCEEKELERLCKGDKIMEKFEKEIKELNKDEEFANMMSQEEEATILHNTLVSEAKEKGMQEGLQEGHKTGLQEGSNKKALEIAKRMLDMNLDIEMISKATSLSKEEINKLK